MIFKHGNLILSMVRWHLYLLSLSPPGGERGKDLIFSCRSFTNLLCKCFQFELCRCRKWISNRLVMSLLCAWICRKGELCRTRLQKSFLSKRKNRLEDLALLGCQLVHEATKTSLHCFRVNQFSLTIFGPAVVHPAVLLWLLSGPSVSWPSKSACRMPRKRKEKSWQHPKVFPGSPPP